MHWTQVLVLPECGFESQPDRSRRLCPWARHFNHNCFVLRMGRKAVGPVCCVMHVKEPRTLIVKEKGLALVFLDLHLEHPAGWICARYKSSVLLLLLNYNVKGKNWFNVVLYTDLCIALYVQCFPSVCEKTSQVTWEGFEPTASCLKGRYIIGNVNKTEYAYSLWVIK